MVNYCTCTVPLITLLLQCRFMKYFFSVSPIYSLPKPPEVSEEMIQSIISSIKKVIESEELNIDIEQHSSNEAAPGRFLHSLTHFVAFISSMENSNNKKNGQLIENVTFPLDPVEAETEAVITKKTESKITTTVPSSSTTILTTTTSETTTTTRTITFDEKDYSEEICDTVPNNSLLRNGLGSTGFTWPDGVIPYEVNIICLYSGSDLFLICRFLKGSMKPKKRQ